MKRLILELRRLRGWLAWSVICRSPSWVSPFVFGHTLLVWAMIYAHPKAGEAA